jgi:chaperonin GroEL
MNREIIKNKDLEVALRTGIDKLASAVLETMGPNGNTVGIIDGLGKPYVTKDGVTVARHVVLNDQIEQYGAELLKEVANRTVEQAGDGTTTSICLAQSFINTGFDLLNDNVQYKDIKKALEIIEQHVVSELKYMSTVLNPKKIIDVATVSSNNDDVIGKLIQTAYTHSNIVKVEESDSIEDELITINGMNLRGSYFNKAYINNAKKQAIEYSKVKFIIVKGKVNNIKDIKNFINGEQVDPIVIVADHFSDSVNSILKDNYNKGHLQIGLVKSPGFAQHRKDLIEDIIYYTSAKVTSSSNIYIGEVDKLFADKNSLIITKEIINTNDSRLENLIEALKIEDESHSKDLLEDRISNLTGKVSIIKVGGNSEIEMRERKDRIDDAVLAVKCALEEGVVPGGGHALRNIAKEMLFTKEPIVSLIGCLHEPYELIGVKRISAKIVDPTKVTRCALQNSISVAKTILSTKAVVIS